MSWWTVSRNLVLLAMAVVVVWKAKEIPSPWPILSRGSIETATLAALGALTVVLTLTLYFLFYMLQQNGRLLLRIESVEKRLNIDLTAEPLQGLPVGDAAPAFELEALEGGTMSLSRLRETGKPILLVFAEPECRACEVLQPELTQWQRDYERHLVIVPVSRGDFELNRRKAATHGLRNVLLQADRNVADAYGVTATPSAVLVVDGKIASRVAAGSDAIRALIADAVQPAPVKRGDLVPSVQLLDLSGGAADLASLRGRVTLLLFWNPSCGFCQKMLHELKAWERPDGAPDLVVISSGPLEACRDVRFRAKVLVDPYFSSGRLFGAAGTPSAVVLDERGRVASDVVVGASAVFALAANWIPAVST